MEEIRICECGSEFIVTNDHPQQHIPEMANVCHECLRSDRQVFHRAEILIPATSEDGAKCLPGDTGYILRWSRNPMIVASNGHLYEIHGRDLRQIMR